MKDKLSVLRDAGEYPEFFLPSRCFGNTKTPLKELEVFNDPHATG